MSLIEDIYQNLDKALALAELSPEDKGNYYVLTCPGCGRREAYIYKTGARIECNRRDKCGFSQSLWDYFKEAKGLSQRETLEQLASLAGVQLQGDNSQDSRNEINKAEIWKAVVDFFRKELKGDSGKEAREYLRSRGYSEQEIERMGLGLYVSVSELKDYLLSSGYQGDALEWIISSLKSIPNDYKIVIPYYDPAGLVKGIIVRAISNEVKPKYRYNKGLTRETPFNLDRARGNQELIVVEGYLDALAIREKSGLGNVIALGDSSLSQTKLTWCLKYGAKSFILALDNDRAGEEGTEKAIKLLLGEGLKAYVLRLPEDTKDPDELIRKKGPEAFKELSKNPDKAVKWEAERILRRPEIKTGKGRDEIIESAISFMERIQSPVERHDFEESVAGELGLTPSLLESEFKSYKEKKTREALKRDYRKTFEKGLGLIEAGDLQAFEAHLKESSTEFQIKAAARIPELYTASLLEEDIRRARPGLKTGYANLDDLFSIPPEAITIIGARPSHGKTTFLMNLALNMVKAVPDRSFFFFSYEESRRQIGVKFLNILSGYKFDSEQNIKCLEDMIRGDGQDQNNVAWEKIERGRAELESLTESKRLWIIDEPYFVDELAEVLTLFKKQYDIGAVFIDYIQKIKIAGRYATRQMELQKVSETILETAKKLSIPIILGAQLGRDPQHSDKVRLDNLREAGDIEQDANLVLGLFNPAMEKAQDNGETSREDTVDLQVTVLKNRNGPVNETRTLNFIRPLLTIKDKPTGW